MVWFVIPLPISVRSRASLGAPVRQKKRQKEDEKRTKAPALTVLSCAMMMVEAIMGSVLSLFLVLPDVRTSSHSTPRTKSHETLLDSLSKAF